MGAALSRLHFPRGLPLLFARIALPTLNGRGPEIYSPLLGRPNSRQWKVFIQKSEPMKEGGGLGKGSEGQTRSDGVWGSTGRKNFDFCQAFGAF